jgi:hypothetical protein
MFCLLFIILIPISFSRVDVDDVVALAVRHQSGALRVER